MLKKFTSYVLITVLLLCLMPASATASNVGDVVGEALHTDIVAYINHYAIPSYAVNGTSCIVAEDLRNFCFDVSWDNNTRSLYIARNAETLPTGMTFEKTGLPSTKFADILHTDISVYADGIKLTSYAMNGYTMIPIEELTMFGECHWVNGERAIKLWIDGINCLAEKQAVNAYKVQELVLPDDETFDSYVMKEGNFLPVTKIRHHSKLGFSIEYPEDLTRVYSGNSLTLGWLLTDERYSAHLTITKYTDWDAESMKHKLMQECPGIQVDFTNIAGETVCYLTEMKSSKWFPRIRRFFLIENNGVLYVAETEYIFEAEEGIGHDFRDAIRSIKFY